MPVSSKAAVAVLALLYGLAPGAIARRVGNRVSSERTVDLEDPDDLFGAIYDAIQEENWEDGHVPGSLLQEEEGAGRTQQHCLFNSAGTLRYYHFELETADGTPWAVELIRNPIAPRLKIYVNHSWNVRATTDKAFPVEWEAFPRDDKARLPLEIDFIKDVRDVHVSKNVNKTEGEDRLEINFKDGKNMSIIGGAYLPSKVLYYMIHKNMTEWKPAATVIAEAVALHMGRGIGKKVAKHAVVWSMLQKVPDILQAELHGGLTTLGMGFVLGGGVGVGVAVGEGFYEWVRAHRELRITAVEKIADKLYCNFAMLACEDGDLLLPKPIGVNMTCPGETYRDSRFARAKGAFRDMETEVVEDMKAVKDEVKQAVEGLTKEEEVKPHGHHEGWSRITSEEFGNSR